MPDLKTRNTARDTALFATVEHGDAGQTLTFRVGVPCSLNAAHARFDRLWEAGAIRASRLAPDVRIRHARRWYPVRFMEVRSVDRHGRGLGRADHGAAVPVPVRAVERIG